ncbi:MAG: hypothetical protein KA174_05450 [Chitinophagales bacterium]|jgi:hypothetical protein|nr:hypothetical protein [Saprospirales bacterium]MBK8351169.1 hypothetical protein [Saprospirales bacterium]MBP6660106.1 hypothetical protein [Chitinophagales bacterium]
MIKKIVSLLLLFLFISVSFADIPTDANGYNIDSNAFNYLPLTLGLLFAIGSTIAYFTYKNQKNAVQ